MTARNLTHHWSGRARRAAQFSHVRPPFTCHPFHKQPIFSTLRVVSSQELPCAGHQRRRLFSSRWARPGFRAVIRSSGIKDAGKPVVDVRLSVEKVQLTPAESFRRLSVGDAATRPS